MQELYSLTNQKQNSILKQQINLYAVQQHYSINSKSKIIKNQMLNNKVILRKKSQHQFSTKQNAQNDQALIKRKKSTTTLTISKTKKQQINLNKNSHKQKQQPKLIHSHSKGKLKKKTSKIQHYQKILKAQKNDENVNSLNHKKSLDKFKQVKIHIKQKQTKSKISTDRFFHTQKQEKIKNIHTQAGNGLVRIKSLSKLNPLKHSESKICFKKCQKKTSTIQLNNGKYQGKKSISNKVETLKKPLGKNKSKKIEYTSINLKRPKLKAKKISQIIQKSILYSQVNFDFKQQISFLAGSGIKQKQQIFLPYYLKSQKQVNRKGLSLQQKFKQQNAATMIQKYFRGYIQRKYIQEAKYIIESIKKIQRFWKKCLKKKIQKTIKAEFIKEQQFTNSLITVKNLDSTKKNDQQKCIQVKITNLESESLPKNNLKQIIKNILDENGLNQTIKQKIRKAMKLEQNDHKEQTNSSGQIKQYKSKNQPTIALPISPINTNKSDTSKPQLLLDVFIQQNNSSKDFYVRKKIHMQMHSQKNFNSPMNVSNNQSPSPAMKKLISPKCLSNSFSKQMKANYNNYFKSTKNTNCMFNSPKKLLEQNQKIINSHSGQKYRFNNNNYSLSSDEKLFNANTEISNHNQKIGLNKQNNEIKNNSEVLELSNSPIIRCTELQNNYDDDINLLQSEKFSQIQTQRFFKKNQIPQAQNYDILKPFPTAFYFIQQFCLLITDYLRADQETTQIFIQKFKGLKFFKIERIFRQWQRLEFQQYQDNNIQFQQLMIQQTFQRPSILSRSEKKMIMQLPSLRLFLNDNQYSDNQVLKQKSPQNTYIKFIFDIFEQSIYKNFIGFNIKNLHKGYIQQKKNDSNYINVILSQALGNISQCAQMLCGSFQDSQQLTDYQKAQKQLINQQRLFQMTNKFTDWDFTTCQIWINMLVYKKIFDQIISEVVVDLLVKL